MAFLELAPELRNRIYDHVIPKHEDIGEALSITSLAIGERAHTEGEKAGAFATQPAITQISRQLRMETLGMFYYRSIFVAYIEKSDFSPILRWVESVTSGLDSGPNQSSDPRSCHIPRLQVHVKLLARVDCERSVLQLVKGWMGVKHHDIVHLTIHKCYTADLAKPWYALVGRYDSRELMVQAVMLAEQLRRERAGRDPVGDEEAVRTACGQLIRQTVLTFVACEGLDCTSC